MKGLKGIHGPKFLYFCTKKNKEKFLALFLALLLYYTVWPTLRIPCEPCISFHHVSLVSLVLFLQE